MLVTFETELYQKQIADTRSAAEAFLLERGPCHWCIQVP